MLWFHERAINPDRRREATEKPISEMMFRLGKKEARVMSEAFKRYSIPSANGWNDVDCVRNKDYLMGGFYEEEAISAPGRILSQFAG